MNSLDIATLKPWIGKQIESSDLLSPRQAHLMAATLGLPQEPYTAGAELPELWHWLYCLEGAPPQALGRDGHPARGGFLPPVPLANRMWAGGDVHFLRPLRLGSPIHKRSRIQSINHKQGRSGDLVFVSVVHEISQADQLAITEIHDIVYKNPSPDGPQTVVTPMPEPLSRTFVTPDSTTLFRYSALTFNGHRIHYDVDYCRQVEGYDNLVIHGPLNATLLAGLARRVAGRALRQFRYRGVQPALLGQTLSLNAVPGRSGPEIQALTLWVALQTGAVSMRAEALF